MFLLIKLLFLPIWLPFKMLEELIEHSGRRKHYKRRRRYRRGHEARRYCRGHEAAERAPWGSVLKAIMLLFLICWPLALKPHPDGSPSSVGWIVFGVWLPVVGTSAALIASTRNPMGNTTSTSRQRQLHEQGQSRLHNVPTPEKYNKGTAPCMLATPPPGVLTCHECGHRNYIVRDTRGGELPNQRRYCPNCGRDQPHHVN